VLPRDLDYDQWVEVGMALHHELGELGFKVWARLVEASAEVHDDRLPGRALALLRPRQARTPGDRAQPRAPGQRARRAHRPAAQRHGQRRGVRRGGAGAAEPGKPHRFQAESLEEFIASTRRPSG
jgi:hypothetical protein